MKSPVSHLHPHHDKNILAPRHHRSPAERRSHGKSLRGKIAREDHGGWKAPKERRDPV